MADKPTPTQRVIDRLAAARESERLRADLVELLDDEPFTELRDWADRLTEVADAMDEAREAIETWRDAEEREERAEAKESALDALDTFLTAWDEHPLDLASLTVFDAAAEAVR